MEKMPEEKEKIYCMNCEERMSKQQVVNIITFFLSLIILNVKIYPCIFIFKQVNPNAIHLTHNSMNLTLLLSNFFIIYI